MFLSTCWVIGLINRCVKVSATQLITENKTRNFFLCFPPWKIYLIEMISSHWRWTEEEARRGYVKLSKEIEARSLKSSEESGRRAVCGHLVIRRSWMASYISWQLGRETCAARPARCLTSSTAHRSANVAHSSDPPYSSFCRPWAVKKTKLN